jgi:hypothetical protein
LGPKLRNAIFHADYSFNAEGLNLVSEREVRSHDDIELLSALANASHDAVVLIRKLYIESYTEPKIISAHGWSPDPDEKAVVIVRAGHGAVGLKHAFTASEIGRGAIPWRMTVGYPDEIALLDADPELALLPERAAATVD